jgi:hypothetical protein
LITRIFSNQNDSSVSVMQTILNFFVKEAVFF